MSILAASLAGGSTQALEAYEALADSYDVLTRDYQHERWLQELEGLATRYGLNGDRLLDLGCGTGKSFLPMLRRGYRVTACDISGAMLAIAQRKAPTAVLHEADLRELPTFGAFDLVTALDDPFNYLLAEDELQAALQGVRRNLSERGLALFDLNTLAQYRGQFAEDASIDDPDTFVAWRGRNINRSAGTGAVVEATVEVFKADGVDVWRRSTSTHRQRHWPQATIERLAIDARLEILGVHGQRPGVQIDQHLDELVHIKAIYVARAGKEEAMSIGGL